MTPEFTYGNLKNSIAGLLKSQYKYPVYVDPNQQDTDPPCFFIFIMPESKVKYEIGNFYLLDMGIDIVFVQERNLTGMYTSAEEIALFLNLNLELFNYSDGTNTCEIRALEREWKIENSELHYQFRIKERMYIVDDSVKMGAIEELNADITEVSNA